MSAGDAVPAREVRSAYASGNAWVSVENAVQVCLALLACARETDYVRGGCDIPAREGKCAMSPGTVCVKVENGVCLYQIRFTCTRRTMCVHARLCLCARAVLKVKCTRNKLFLLLNTARE